jgi:amino acid transporter
VERPRIMRGSVVIASAMFVVFAVSVAVSYQDREELIEFNDPSAPQIAQVWSQWIAEQLLVGAIVVAIAALLLGIAYFADTARPSKTLTPSTGTTPPSPDY